MNAKACAFWKLHTAMMYPENPLKAGLAEDDSVVVKVAPAATLAVVKDTLAAPLDGKPVSLQVPACARPLPEVNGSFVVFAMAKPVSKPTILATKGNSRFVMQSEIGMATPPVGCVFVAN
jgi:hypothetical protein